MDWVIDSSPALAWALPVEPSKLSPPACRHGEASLYPGAKPENLRTNQSRFQSEMAGIGLLLLKE